jgi:signal peptidase I
MMLDQPWKIALVVAALIALRIVWGLWAAAPHRKGMIEFLDSGLIAFVLVFLIVRPFVVQAFFIPSESMVPNLMKGDRILVNRFVYRLNEPQRGDIIVFDAPPQAGIGNGHQDFVKRLIGLPGDHVQIKAGDGVYLNGQRVEEPPGVSIPEYDWPAGTVGITGSDVYTVPAGYYLVLGDNRNNSRDSHMWRDADGRAEPELEANRLRGKAMVIFWPPARIRLLGDHRQLRLR